jgi:hypothetical protein
MYVSKVQNARQSGTVSRRSVVEPLLKGLGQSLDVGIYLALRFRLPGLLRAISFSFDVQTYLRSHLFPWLVAGFQNRHALTEISN